VALRSKYCTVLFVMTHLYSTMLIKCTICTHGFPCSLKPWKGSEADKMLVQKTFVRLRFLCDWNLRPSRSAYSPPQLSGVVSI